MASPRRRSLSFFSKASAWLRAPDFLEPPPAHKALVNFAPDTLERWTMMTDKRIGGSSKCALTPIEGAGERALWSGHTSLDVDRLVQQQYGKSQQKAVASKVGFVSMMLPMQESNLGLYDFHGLRLTCRPRDARKYVLTLRAGGSLGDHRTEDLYQTSLQQFVPHAKPAVAKDDVDADGVGSSEAAQASGDDGDGGASLRSGGPDAAATAHEPLLDLRIPWGAFLLTWRGHVQTEKPPAMNLDKLNYVGLLLADKSAGEFAIELGGLSAFRYGDDESVHDDHVRHCLGLNVAMGYDDVLSG